MRIISGKHRGTKLYTLDGLDTRPTLDRIKEPLFSIINFELDNAVVLDLFAGSGALGLESISRGASKAVLCDKSPKAIDIINKNIQKMKVQEKAQVINKDYLVALENLKGQKFDIVFVDPPYESDFTEKAIKKIAEYGLLNQDGKIIVETDKKGELIAKIERLDLFDIYDDRKYGRVSLIFLRLK